MRPLIGSGWWTHHTQTLHGGEKEQLREGSSQAWGQLGSDDTIDLEYSNRALLAVAIRMNFGFFSSHRMLVLDTPVL